MGGGPRGISSRIPCHFNQQPSAISGRSDGVRAAAGMHRSLRFCHLREKALGQYLSCRERNPNPNSRHMFPPDCKIGANEWEQYWSKSTMSGWKMVPGRGCGICVRLTVPHFEVSSTKPNRTTFTANLKFMFTYPPGTWRRFERLFFCPRQIAGRQNGGNNGTFPGRKTKKNSRGPRTGWERMVIIPKESGGKRVSPLSGSPTGRFPETFLY